MNYLGCELSLYSGRWNRQSGRALMTDVTRAVQSAARGRAYVGDFELRPVNTNDGCRVRVRVVLELFRFPAGDVVAEWTEAVRLAVAEAFAAGV